MQRALDIAGLSGALIMAVSIGTLVYCLRDYGTFKHHA